VEVEQVPLWYIHFLRKAFEKNLIIKFWTEFNP
jgi:hypothetical protein